MNQYELWYRRPARAWEEALPIGNGRIGAMVFGGAEEERLALNEDTLWSGYPKDKNNPEAKEHLKSVRDKIKAGEIAAAEEETNRFLLGQWTESYLPLGDLLLEMQGAGEISDYRRSLDIRTGLSRTEFVQGGVRFVRTAFVSYPAQALVVRVEAEGGTFSLRASLESPLRHRVYPYGGALRLDGDCPAKCAPSYVEDAQAIDYEDEETSRTVRFASALTAQAEGGRMLAGPDGLIVAGARAVTLLYFVETSFSGFGEMPAADAQEKLCRAMEAVKGQDYETLLQAHSDDVTALFDRVDVDFGHNAALEQLPTEERLLKVQQGEDDPGLCALLYQYGRYLMIASSRPDTAPANLQGIWNQHMRAPWSSNYTININTEMNYWPVETANLSECAQPLIEWMHAVSRRGAETAREHYGLRGWVAHHNSDLWAHTAPVGDVERKQWSVGYAPWAFGSGWLCEPLWEHYAFAGDTAYLKEVYPILAEAARFYLDFLVEDENGQLVTMLSISPENSYIKDGKEHNLDRSPTMDSAILRELFENLLAAQQALGVNDDLTAPIRAALLKLPEPRIGADGRLLEWHEELEECEIQHRHVSHLYGLYPAGSITPEDTPELAEACRQSLLTRGYAGTGWSLAWKICLWARLYDGESCYRLIRQQLTPVSGTDTNYSGGGGSYPNLLDAHPPFQIDGNFGYTAGVNEMLVQSHRGCPKLLPALPKAWKDGHAYGIRLRGGKTVNMAWKDGQITFCEIK